MTGQDTGTDKSVRKTTATILVFALAGVLSLACYMGADPSNSAPDTHTKYESKEGKAKVGPGYATYRARWAQCRKILWLRNHKDLSGLKLGWGGKGRYRDMRKCRKTWLKKAKKDTLLAIRYVWPESQWHNADLVTACEAGPSRRIDARGDSGHSRSSWQINDLYWTYNILKIERNAVYAARVAHGIWENRGWSPWTCGRRHGLS
jgi:hypothetical protein